ncbi:SH3-containing GRB2-like protein 3-interacting protein 1 [Acridotheres tristis]
MMEGLKKRTRKAFGIRRKEKDTDSTGSPDRDGIQPSPHPNDPTPNSKAEGTQEGGNKNGKKTNGAPNGFYAEIDWDRYNSPELDEEGYSIRPEEPGCTKGKHFYSSSESEEEEEAHKKFNIKIKPLQAKDALRSAATVDELKASVGNIALSPSPVVSPARPSPAPGARLIPWDRPKLGWEDDAFVDKLPAFERRSETPAGSSRGPSPLTMGAQDTLPVAAAFTETVNAYFKGADPNKCIVKITGEMVLSFPAGITRHFANNPAPAVLTFRVLNFNRLEHVLPNPQLLCCDSVQSDSNSKEFWVNMPNLMTHLKKVSEQKPQATYYNVDMLKYQVSAQGIQSTPLNLAVSWRCDPASTDLRIDYKYNTEAMTAPVALNNVQFLVPVDGGVTKLQAVLPPAVWNAEQQRILWKIPDISQKSENGGVGSLLARFQLSEGPSSPAPLAVQFTSEGSTLSSCDIELVGAGYRFSLIKKRFAAGKYLADN